MCQRKYVYRVLCFTVFGLLLLVSSISGQDRLPGRLWQHRGDITKLDLRFGPGAEHLAPVAPFTFIKEEKDGDSPKFRVKDARDVTWVVKLGPESQAETVATRLVWAAGYFAEEAYYLHRAEIDKLPRLSRGREHVENGRIVRGARFEPRRDHIKRGPIWRWSKNPFVGTRELYGLKVLMVLLNNYDTRPENNRILSVSDNGQGGPSQRYVVTDMGATLGHVGGLGGRRSKNVLKDFRSSKFIRRVSGNTVEFHYNTTPKGLGYFTFVFAPPYWRSQAAKEKAMKRVNIEHARWIGGVMSRLTESQLRDAFEAAGYDPDTAAGFISVIRSRIHSLGTLPAGTRSRTPKSRRRAVG